jgi:transcriptional regulator GlxA family with amidase domain
LLTGPAQFSILGTMQLYCEVFSRYGPHRAIPQPLAKQLREQTLSTMWLSVPNNHTDTIFRAPASGEGFRVGQARDLIASESRAEYTVPSLARAVSIGVRALEIAFRKEFDETPLQYLRRTRLERTHDELRYLDPAQATVSEIAVRWGFGHLGRFAAQYRARFGEMPSETLARPTR